VIVGGDVAADGALDKNRDEAADRGVVEGCCGFAHEAANLGGVLVVAFGVRATSRLVALSN